MMTLTEKASYLKGLMDGMNLDTTTNEGKLFAAIADKQLLVSPSINNASGLI